MAGVDGVHVIASFWTNLKPAVKSVPPPVPVSFSKPVLPGICIDEKPDLVLMDCNLSDRNGLDILAEIRSNPLLVDLPIIMTSGIDLSDESKLKGADGFLLKPYSPDLLLETIKNKISGGGE